MDKNIKFELTKNELETLIFLGASRVCDQKQLVGSEVGKLCEDAADICIEVIDHLTGKNPFDPDEMKITDEVLHNDQTTIILAIKRS